MIWYSVYTQAQAFFHYIIYGPKDAKKQWNIRSKEQKQIFRKMDFDHKQFVVQFIGSLHFVIADAMTVST